jgi:hypothetical protein
LGTLCPRRGWCGSSASPHQNRRAGANQQQAYDSVHLYLPFSSGLPVQRERSAATRPRRAGPSQHREKTQPSGRRAGGFVALDRKGIRRRALRVETCRDARLAPVAFSPHVAAARHHAYR